MGLFFPILHPADGLFTAHLWHTNVAGELVSYGLR